MGLNDKAAWTPDNVMRDVDRWSYTLTDKDIDELVEATENWMMRQRPVSELSRGDFVIPGLEDRLKEVAVNLEHGTGFNMIHGVPVNDLSYEEVSVLYAGLGCHLGTPIAQSIDNELVHDVYSKGESLLSKKGRGTQTCDSLPFHTDRADLVGLLCLNKAQQGGQSRIVSALSVFNEIASTRPDLADILCQSFTNIRAPWEHQAGGPTYKIPIFSIYRGHFACRYLRNFIRLAQDIDGVPKLTEAQEEALDLVDYLCAERFAIDIDFEPGDIQFINNFVTLHGRSAYVDHDEPRKRRHLLRLWLSSPISRPLDKAFTPLYGSVSAGSLRGGMLAQQYLEQNLTELA